MKKVIKSSELVEMINDKYNINGYLNDDVLGKFEWCWSSLSTSSKKFRVEAYFKVAPYKICEQYKTDIYELNYICFSPTFMGEQTIDEFLNYAKKVKAAEYISQTLEDILSQYYIING